MDNFTPQPALFEQAHRLRFDDPSLEAAYYLERRDRDVQQTRRIAFTIAVLASVLGLVIIASRYRGLMPMPVTWIFLRFVVLVPSLLLMSFFAGHPWGKVHLQTLLYLGLIVAAGANALEWVVEWSPAMPIRILWLLPTVTLWAALMSLPLNTRSAIIATVGTFSVAELGMTYFVHPLGGPMLLAMAVAYAFASWAFTLLVQWRERDGRMLFLHRHEAEQFATKLRAQNQLLRQLVEQRNEFVAGVLHDLRSPLSAVLVGTGFLRAREELPPAQRAKALDEIAAAAQRVDAFASRFLEQSSLERAAAEPMLAHLSLNPIVERAVAHAQVNAGHKRQRVVCELSVATPTVVADELLLDRALGNLLDNAVKYSPAGAVIVVRVTAEPVSPARARVTVIDAGPGLSAAERARLFRPYATLGKIPTGGEPSTGLGLSLVKHCVDAMGGAVGCESEPGHGATFWVSLKCA